MTNLFDQYEQAATRGRHLQQHTMPEPVSTGFINASLEDDIPIFNKHRVNYNPKEPITHLRAANNFLVMAFTSNILNRLDLENPNVIDEVELPKSVDDRVYNIFLDPTGRHLIISMMSCENYYLSRNSKKAKSIGKLKGHQISAVGWNHQNTTDTSTGEILIGTNKGLILETEITSGEDNKFFQASLEQYVKQLFNVGKDKTVPVTGIEFDKIPTSAVGEYRYFVMLTTPGRLYQFIGNIPNMCELPIFQHVFARYLEIPERFLELPGNFGYSDLKFYHDRYRVLPKYFAWMTGPGIYFGGLDITGKVEQDSITMDTKLIPYPCDKDDKNSTPLAIAVTEFHVLVLYHDRFKAISTLNDQLVFDEPFSEQRFGKLISMCKDPLKGTIWAYTGQAVFKYKVVRESRDVWQMYLSKNEFALAKQYCKDNLSQMDKVLTKQAEYLFEIEKYCESADVYAQTQNSFEEVTLKFINLDQKEALRKFLLRKLINLGPQDKTQLTMLITWLVEIYLNQLGQLKEQEGELSQRYEGLQDEFRKFLAHTKVKDCVEENKNLVYDLIASHGDVEDMIFFAVLTQDYERVISHHLQHESYVPALEVLARQTDTSLFYKFSPVFMQNIPKQTVDAWIKQREKLEPKKLIPALVQYDHERNLTQDHEAIRYLEFCVQVLSIKDQAIHNYLLALYAKLEPEQLLKYLDLQGTERDDVCYDLKYALRLCTAHNHKRACVHIYSTMGLYEEAVDLALQVDVDIAKQNADKPYEDSELRKKLWLKIARHVVEKEKDIKRAMEFLQECELKIEDILPFFPDFVTIDHFKDAICSSLQDYNAHIETLKHDMEEATQSASDIRGEIQTFRNKFTFVNSQDKCSLCAFPLMTRSFYVFPCQHCFHSDCLTGEILPHLVSSKRIRVEELQRKLVSRETNTSPARTVSRSLSMGPDAIIKEELDNLVASECIFCGDIMIRCVDKPFIDDEEFSSIMSSWL